MPLRNQPPTLQKASMVSIARNFDNICYNVKSRAEMCQMIYDESYLQVAGPFQQLPAGLVAGLTEQVRDLGRVRRHHLHILVLPQLHEFSISFVGETILALQLLTQRCRRLRRVNLSYLRDVDPIVMLRLAPSLTEVTSLNLSMTHIIDQFLELIGRNCAHLRELDISNTPITDSALSRLCYDQEQGAPQCQKLERVSVTGCSISPYGPACLIRHLPRLYHLDFDYIFQVFEVLQEWGVIFDNMKKGKTFPLRVLTSASDYIDSTSVDNAITLCPMAVEVTLSNAVVSNELLYQTMRLEHLAHLRITNCEGLTLDFHEGVLPVLTLRGAGLVSLLLTNFTIVDLVAVGECCPRLQNLALSGITLYEEIMYPRDTLFTSLVNLEVWTTVQTETCTTAILRQLLTFCPQLQNLLFRGAEALSDKLLQDIWRTNPMKRLSRLTLDACHNITAASIYHLLASDNKLTLVRMWSCIFITRQDYNDIKNYVKNSNCDVYLEWYSWDG